MVEKRDETYIDPQFFLPPNVFDIRYIDKDDNSEGEDVPEFSESDSGPTDITNVTADSDFVVPLPEATTELPIPDNLTVVSQTVKAAAGGGYLVDIVIDIPDMPGVENFDVAVTKA